MGMFMDFEATCPVDGTRFTYSSTPSYSIFGRALDGLPQGSWFFPLELAQCPACRFPVEIGTLDAPRAERARALIARDDYRRMAEEETPYRLLYFVMEALDLGVPMARVDRLLQATWQTYGEADRYGRYAAELGAAMDAAGEAFRAECPEDWAVYSSFIANVERQAGNWKAAVRRLDQIEAIGLKDADLAARIAQTRRLIADGDARPGQPGS